MFTGIVREIGTIDQRRRGSGVTSFLIAAPRLADRLAVGDSLAVNGVCMTVTARTGSTVAVDVSGETLGITTAASWQRGDRVHLEPALGASDAIGGHFVLGHVDGVGSVRQTRPIGDTKSVSIEPPAELRPHLLPKGSVAVDGVSLTLDAGPFLRTFTLTLIPQTLRETRLGALRPGDRVNVEVDVLAKAAARQRDEEARPSTSLSLADVMSRGWTRRGRHGS
jgi:riboflavin synthase